MKPLEQGEFLCPKCKGTGAEPGHFHSPAPVCSRCWGEGKLDWIEMAMGKPNPRRTLKGNWTLEMDGDITAIYDCDLEREIIDALAVELAEEVDREILEKINMTVYRKTLK